MYSSKFNYDLRVMVGMNRHNATCFSDIPKGFRTFEVAGSDGQFNNAAARDPFLNNINKEKDCAKEIIGFANER